MIQSLLQELVVNFGNCKITRFEIDGHIKLDKLIGTIVNEAAHQATGK